MSDSLKDLLNDLTETQIPTKKAKNSEAAVQANLINSDDFDVLKLVVQRHTRLNMYLIYSLAVGLFFLASACITGYCRLEDKISSQGDVITSRIDNEKNSNTERLDKIQQFNMQRFDSITSSIQQYKKNK